MNRIERVLLSSSILLASLILWGLWNIIPVEYEFKFPFYDIKNKVISFSPEDKLGYQLYDIMPYLVDRFIPIIYFVCFNIVGEMRMPILGNIWNYYLFFHIFLFVEYVFFFKQVPVITYCIGALAILQLSYTIYSLSQKME